MAKILRVALVLQSFAENVRAILRGVASYVDQGKAWRLHTAPLSATRATIVRSAVHSDGLITRFYNDEFARIVHKSGVPVVAVPYRGKLPIPSVDTNPEKIAAMAAEHLLARGFRQFAFYGPPGKTFARERFECFQQAVAEQSCSCQSLFAGHAELDFDWNAHEPAIVQWLRQLPKPIGIFTANDVMGQQILLNANYAGIRVPDEIAVVGVDNDEMICRLTSPPLSSIDAAGERIGFEAAAMLDRLMNGEKLETRRLIIDPARLVIRQSSDVLAVDQPYVAEAVRYIRQNVSQNIGVKDVMRQVPVARRTLERAFQRLLGLSIHQEISESRIRRAKQMLIETDMSIQQITQGCGFCNRTHFSNVFRRRTNHSPAAFRRTFRKPR